MQIIPSTYFRKLDSAGRISIPSKLRNKYQIQDRDELQFITIIDDETGDYYLGFKVLEPIENIEKTLQSYGFNNLEELLKEFKHIAQKD